MADINQVISLGIGSPADIPHFILVGLSVNDAVAATTVGAVDVVGRHSPILTVTGRHDPALTITGRHTPTIDVVGLFEE